MTEKPMPSPTDAYAQLWFSIYGEASWHSNPWTWAYAFRRVTP